MFTGSKLKAVRSGRDNILCKHPHGNVRKFLEGVGTCACFVVFGLF